MEKEVKVLTVEDLRVQSARMGGDRPVQLVWPDGQKKNVILVQCYPDTVDVNGNWGSTFKIEVAPE